MAGSLAKVVPDRRRAVEAGEHGFIGRRCTGRYKIEPIEQQIRKLLGAPVYERRCRYCDASGVRVAP